MARPKLSEWQDPSVKPKLAGAYQVKEDDRISWRYWHGMFWDATYSDKETCLRDSKFSMYRSVCQNNVWRGVLE